MGDPFNDALSGVLVVAAVVVSVILVGIAALLGWIATKLVGLPWWSGAALVAVALALLFGYSRYLDWRATRAAKAGS